MDNVLLKLLAVGVVLLGLRDALLEALLEVDVVLLRLLVGVGQLALFGCGCPACGSHLSVV